MTARVLSLSSRAVRRGRCPCCEAVMPDRTGWRPGDPIDAALCTNCKSAGCRHKYEHFFARGDECPMRARNRRAASFSR
jgi:hypothetical protein